MNLPLLDLFLPLADGAEALSDLDAISQLGCYHIFF